MLQTLEKPLLLLLVGFTNDTFDGANPEFLRDHVFAWSGQEALTAGVTTLLDFYLTKSFLQRRYKRLF